MKPKKEKSKKITSRTPSIFSIILNVTLAITSGIFHGTKKLNKFIKKPKTRPIFQEFKTIKGINGNIKDFERFILKNPSSLGIIVGARGSGKSALGLRIAENVFSKTNRRVYAMGFKEESVPSWIKNLEDLKKIKNGSFVLIDEGGVLFSSRKSASKINRLLSEILLISRHKDLSILFISQNSSNLDINILRQADYILLKKPSLLQKEFERKIIQKIYDKISKKFKKYKSPKVFFVYSDCFEGFAISKLPSFWSSKVSKSFS